MKYYLAYGSNLDVAQMLDRCPGALYVGTTHIPGRLCFRGSKTGSFLSVDLDAEGSVPCVVWAISAENERSLDVYEGYPNFYEKANLRVTVTPFSPSPCFDVTAMIYVLPEASPLGAPTRSYYNVCLGGYRQFKFQASTLLDALKFSVGSRAAYELFKQPPYSCESYVPVKFRLRTKEKFD